MLEKQLSYLWFSCFLFGPLHAILSSCSGFELGALQHQERQLCHGANPQMLYSNTGSVSGAVQSSCGDEHMAQGVSIRWLHGCLTQGCNFWLCFTTVAWLSLAARWWEEPGNSPSPVTRPDPACACSPSATALNQDSPSIVIPLFPREMHLPYRREIQIDPHHLWNLDFFKRLSSTVLFNCNVTFLLHQYDGGFQQQVHSPSYKPCTRWAVPHQKQQEDNILPRRNIKQSNKKKCRCGARGGIFPCLDAAQGLGSAGRHYRFYSTFPPKQVDVEEEKRQNEGSAWREW